VILGTVILHDPSVSCTGCWILFTPCKCIAQEYIRSSLHCICTGVPVPGNTERRHAQTTEASTVVMQNSESRRCRRIRSFDSGDSVCQDAHRKIQVAPN
jgi:hypothetical protein